MLINLGFHLVQRTGANLQQSGAIKKAQSIMDPSFFAADISAETSVNRFWRCLSVPAAYRPAEKGQQFESQGKTSFIQIPIGFYRARPWLRGNLIS
ncbi:hypothetical protein BK139_13665 [Paenibacillus sp. FSL R5-0490]|nr:hypothetical protein BK139_13665 [Paenibacillus sp. FSL R5-0490]